MGTFAESITRIIPECGRTGNLFADGVILVSTTHRGPQALLDTAIEWAHTMDVTLATKKCHVLEGPFLEGQASFRIHGEALYQSTTEPYLGISVTVKGVDITATLERV